MIKIIGTILMLLAMKTLSATEAEGRQFAESLLPRGYETDGATHLKAELSQATEHRENDKQQSEMQSVYDAQFDSGKKGEDPLKGFFGQKSVEKSREPQLTQPNLGDAETLLKPKHQFKINAQDPLFQNNIDP